LLNQNVVLVFSGNFLVAYNSQAVFGPQEIWRYRINDNSQIINSKFIGNKFYLAVKSTINDANPCPLKPLSIGDNAYLVKCADIYHSPHPILADSIISLFQITPDSGKIENTLSFVVPASKTALNFTDDGIYAIWEESGNYIAFFADFLNEKCKSLIPNYILEKLVS